MASWIFNPPENISTLRLYWTSDSERAREKYIIVVETGDWFGSAIVRITIFLSSNFVPNFPKNEFMCFSMVADQGDMRENSKKASRVNTLVH